MWYIALKWLPEWPILLAAGLVWLVPWMMMRLSRWFRQRAEPPWKREQPSKRER